MAGKANLALPPGFKAQTIVDERIRMMDEGRSYIYLNSFQVQAGKIQKTLIRRPSGRYEVKYLTSSKSPGEVLFEVYGLVTITEIGVPPFDPIPFNRNGDFGVSQPPHIEIRLDVDYSGGLKVVSQRIDDNFSALGDSWEDRAIKASGDNPDDTVLTWKNVGITDTYVNFCLSWVETLT
jgi:hypothetical protein